MRPGRDVGFKRAAQGDRSVSDRLHGAYAARSIQDADAHRMPWRNVQDIQQMRRARARKRDVTGITDFAALEDDEVHAPAVLLISAHSRLSTSACRLASTMFSLTPMVPHSVTPSLDWISTRVVAAVPVVESMMRTL